MPERIQLRRTVGWRKPEGAVVVTRPGKWGNPFTGLAAAESLARHLAVRRDDPWPGCTDLIDYPSDDEIRAELAGHDLACWCPLDQPCHADVLLEIANSPVDTAREDQP